MEALPLRLLPGADLREALEGAIAQRNCDAAFVVSAIGSLTRARLRFAGVPAPQQIDGDLEILTLAGTVAKNGAHLHMSVADAGGRVSGGHVASGCTIRTTAEILLLLLPEFTFVRESDADTGYAELVIRRKA